MAAVALKKKKKKNAICETFLGAQWVRDPLLSLLWSRFDFWPWAFQMLQKKKKKKKKARCIWLSDDERKL